MMNTELELIEAESSLAVLEKELQTSKAENAEQGLPADERLTALIEAEFKKDPEVVGLIGEIIETRDHLEHTKDKSATCE